MNKKNMKQKWVNSSEKGSGGAAAVLINSSSDTQPQLEMLVVGARMEKKARKRNVRRVATF